MWGQGQREALDKVRGLLRSSKVFVHFDDPLPLILSCDASPNGLGAVLPHEMADGDERPVGFASPTLTIAEQKYSQIDKEALAVILFVNKSHQYLPLWWGL